MGEDQFFAKIQSAGGTLNGGTSSDATTYYEVVPKNSLGMALWPEADRMGYLLPTVTDDAFLNQPPSWSSSASAPPAGSC